MTDVTDKIRELRETSLGFPPETRRKVNMGLDGIEQAIEAWNIRAERTCENVYHEWSKTSFAGALTPFCCSECGANYADRESYYAGLADVGGVPIRTNYCPNCGAKVVG